MTPRIHRVPSFPAFFAAALATFLVVPFPAAAQTSRPSEFSFAAGAGGFAVSDTGRADVKSFSTGGFRVFGEVELETGVFLQARYESFLLPGSAVDNPFQSATDSPRVKAQGLSLSVGYMFRETWWRAGAIAGIGAFRLTPRATAAGQTPADVEETVIGWHVGLLTTFDVARRVDLRIEASYYLLRTDAAHKPVLGGASLAYHF